jgi:hypothetical protein
MKKIIKLLLLILVALKANFSIAQTKKNSEPMLSFLSKSNFIEVKRGDKSTYTIEFKNLGVDDLIIKDVSSTCLCTVAKYTKEPIKLRQKGSIDISFDSKNKPIGTIKQPIIIETNSSKRYVKAILTIKIV